MKISCRWSPLAEVLAEPNAADLIRAYAEELSPLRDRVPLAPDWPRMAELEKAGLYKLWVCHVNGTLAGYISFLIMPHHHYRDTLFALDQGIYLSPAFRNTPGRVGLRMMRSVEPALRELGVEWVMLHDGVRSLLPFYLALDYHPRSTLYWKEL